MNTQHSQSNYTKPNAAATDLQNINEKTAQTAIAAESYQAILKIIVGSILVLGGILVIALGVSDSPSAITIKMTEWEVNIVSASIGLIITLAGAFIIATAYKIRIKNEK
jgi:deoxycytidylate deaminase